MWNIDNHEEWTRRQTAAFGNLIMMGYAAKSDMVMKDRTRDEWKMDFPWPTYASIFIDFQHIKRILPLATPMLDAAQELKLQAGFDEYYGKIYNTKISGVKERPDGEWFGMQVSHPFSLNGPLPICFRGRFPNLAEVLMYVIQHGSTTFGKTAIVLPNVRVSFQPDPKRPTYRPSWALVLHQSQEQAKDGRFIWRLDLLMKNSVPNKEFVVLYTYD